MSESERITRVVVADDSDVAAAVLEDLLEDDPEIRVVGRARNGSDLLSLPERTIAHVVLLDMLMPELGGLSVLRQIAGECAVIAVSAVESNSAAAAEALALGAAAFFCKRHLTEPNEAARLREAVKQAARRHRPAESRSIVLVVGSTGAISALETVARELGELPAPIIVVQHLPPGRDEALSSLLSVGRIPARVAKDGEMLSPGILVAPSGRHLLIDELERVRLVHTAPVNGHCPSGDVLLKSAVRLGKRVVALILSGLGADGAQGLAELADCGAVCLAQHPREAPASSMPTAALAASPKVRPVRCSDLGRAIRKAVGIDGS